MASTITDILADAFNRVKTEHGVTLSRVEFTDLAAGFIELSFTVDHERYDTKFSNNKMIYPMPADATHYGTIGQFDDHLWKLTDDALYVRVYDRWECFDNDNPLHVLQYLRKLPTLSPSEQRLLLVPDGATHKCNGWYVRKTESGIWEWFQAGRWRTCPHQDIDGQAETLPPYNP